MFNGGAFPDFWLSFLFVAAFRIAGSREAGFEAGFSVVGFEAAESPAGAFVFLSTAGAAPDNPSLDSTGFWLPKGWRFRASDVARTDNGGDGTIVFGASCGFTPVAREASAGLD